MLRSKSFDGAMPAMRKQREIKELNANLVGRDGQLADVDVEWRELEARVKKWLQESSLPASTTTFSDIEFQDEKRERRQRISKSRRHSMPEIQTSSFHTLEGRSGPIVLYHPDFADWTSCEIKPRNNADSTLQRCSSPVLQIVLDKAHDTLSKLFKFDS